MQVNKIKKAASMLFFLHWEPEDRTCYTPTLTPQFGALVIWQGGMGAQCSAIAGVTCHMMQKQLLSSEA